MSADYVRCQMRTISPFGLVLIKYQSCCCQLTPLCHHRHRNSDTHKPFPTLLQNFLPYYKKTKSAGLEHLRFQLRETSSGVHVYLFVSNHRLVKMLILNRLICCFLFDICFEPPVPWLSAIVAVYATSLLLLATCLHCHLHSAFLADPGPTILTGYQSVHTRVD